MDQQSEKLPRTPRSSIITSDETPIVASPESTGRSNEATTPVFSPKPSSVADLESKCSHRSAGAIQAGLIVHRGEDAKRAVMSEMRQAVQRQEQPQQPALCIVPFDGITDPDSACEVDTGLPFTSIRAHHGPPPPRNQTRDGPVNVDEVTLSTFGQSASVSAGERSFTTRGDGDTESIYAPTVSTLGMSSVVTRQRRAWEEQQVRIINSLDCGDFQNENIRVDTATDVLSPSSVVALAHSVPSFPTQPTVEVVATVVDSVVEMEKRRKNPFKDWRVLVFILLAVSSIVGLVVALTTRPKPEESTKGAKEKLIFPVEMNPFSMWLTSSADMIDKNKLNNVTSGHLSEIMKKDIDSFKELDLAVVLVGRRRCGTESEWLRRALAISQKAFFRGSIKLIKDEKLHERFIQDLLQDAFSGNGLEMWLNAANDTGMGITSVTVFGGFGNEIGSLNNETATASPVAPTVAPTFVPSDTQWLTTDAMTTEPTSTTTAQTSVSTSEPSPVAPSVMPTYASTTTPGLPTNVPSTVRTKTTEVPTSTSAPKLLAAGTPTPEPTTATTMPISTPTPKPSPPPNPSPSPLLPTTPPVPEPTGSPTFGPTLSPTELPVSKQTPLPTPTPTLGPTPRPTLLPTPLPTPIPTTPPTPLPTPKPVSTPTLAPVVTTATTATASSRQNVIEITITMTLVISSEDEFNSDIFGSASLDHFFDILEDVYNFNKLALDFSLRWGRRDMRAVRRELSAEAELVLTYTVTFGGDGAVPSEVQAVANNAFSGSELDGLVASFQDEGLGVESVTTYDEEGNELSTSIPADSSVPTSTAETATASSRQNVIEVTVMMAVVALSEDEFDLDIIVSTSLDHFLDFLKGMDNFKALALNISLRWGRRGMQVVERELSAEAELVLTYTITFDGDGAVPSEVQSVANNAFSGPELDRLVASFQDEGLSIESVLAFDADGNELSSSISVDTSTP